MNIRRNALWLEAGGLEINMYIFSHVQIYVCIYVCIHGAVYCIYKKNFNSKISRFFVTKAPYF
jgi:hypothetical protein